MTKLIAVAAAGLALSGCMHTVPETAPGQIVEITQTSATIRGGFSYGQTARPTEAMVSQANQICSGARYLSARPDPDSVYHFLYLFQCPNGPRS